MKKEDLILTKIHNQESLQPTNQNRELLLKLEEKGLVERDHNDSYELTRYGKTIMVMGFETFKKTEEFEKEITKETADVVFKKQMVLISISTFLVLVLVSLLLLL